MRKLLLIMMMLTGVACTPALQSQTATHTATTMNPSPTVEPTSTPISLQIVDPLDDVGQLFRLIAWSPDSQWIAYWKVVDHKPQQDDGTITAILSFVDTKGKICDDEALVARMSWDKEPYMVWQQQHTAVVLTERGGYQGEPCREFRHVEVPSLPDPNVQLSPDGLTTAHLAVRGEDQIENYTVTFTNTETGEIIETASWSGSIFSQRTGPRWLDNDRYVLGQTFDKGLIYYSAAEDRIGEIGKDIFHLENTCNPDACWIHTYANPETGAYHIILLSPSFSKTLLYHSEVDEVEEIPIQMAWPFDPMNSDLRGFSGDGEWLLGLNGPHDPFSTLNKGGEDYWIRHVDPPGGELVLLNRDQPRAWGDISLKTGRAALWDLNGVYIYRFPDGELIEKCLVRGSDPQGVIWSPDGRWLAVEGYNITGAGEQILALCPAPF